MAKNQGPSRAAVNPGGKEEQGSSQQSPQGSQSPLANSEALRELNRAGAGSILNSHEQSCIRPALIDSLKKRIELMGRRPES